MTQWDLAVYRDVLLSLYKRRSALVRDHFHHRPEALLEFDPAREGGTGPLLRFRGIGGIAPGPYPRANTGAPVMG
ncbi:hypothetical protein GCM10011415_06800 [Salipiger pallidus]|uniref:Uncharacterized protein n=1 Tax=Salipiger pallidus TaxID=1775170 RepID=A0A8J2ZH85_9RHOB|nr:hypothetical protein [Salipiger pallidus]GGG63037.1 hypothetical protein GCM10011415_06800 [Salipiger pallidus]